MHIVQPSVGRTFPLLLLCARDVHRRWVKVDGEGVWRCGREEPRYEGFVRPFQPTFIRLTKSFPTEGWISWFFLSATISFSFLLLSTFGWRRHQELTFSKHFFSTEGRMLTLEEVPNQRLDWKKCCSWVKRRGQRLPTSNLRTQVLEGCMNLADSWETWRLYD